jgi:hypothetical protein
MSEASNGKRPLRRTIRGGRPFFFEDGAIDKVLNMVVTLGSEVWALRERLAAVEALQVRRGQLGEGEVDGYEFTAEQESRLAIDRKEFIDNLFRILQEQVQNAAAGVRTARAPQRAGVRTASTAPKTALPKPAPKTGARSTKASKATASRATASKMPRNERRSGAKPRSRA